MKMSFSINTLILLLFAFSFACNQNKKADVPQLANVNETVDSRYTQNKKLDIPEGWKKTEACGLSFYAPTDLKEKEVRGIDSCVKEYQSKNILFSLDMFEGSGEESSSRRNEYSGAKDFQIVETIIDGRKAEIITHYETATDLKQRKGLSYGAVLFVPVINKDGDNLTIWTYSRSVEDRETARKILEKVRFD